MRLIILFTLIPLACFATQDQAQRIRNLELRVERLEKQMSSQGTLKVKDFKQSQSKNKMGTNRSSQKTAPVMTDKQRKEMEDTIKAYKEKQIEHQKALDELMEQP